MYEPTPPLDLSTIDVPNVSKAALKEAKLELGIGHDDSLKRIVYRLNFIEINLTARKAVLAAGNIANLAQEIFISAHLMQDLIDVVREAVTLCAVSAFRQEQAVAPPPKPAATGDENPPDAPRGFDASEQAGAPGSGGQNES